MIVEFGVTSACFNMYRTLFIIGLFASMNTTAQFFQWGGFLQGIGGIGQDVASDSQGNFYWVGNINGVGDLDPGPDTTWSTNTSINGNLFLIKFDGSGNFLWGFSLGASGVDIVRSVAVGPNDDVFITGRMNVGFDFDPDTGTTFVPNAGSVDAFLAKYNPNGGLEWAVPIGGNGHDEAFDVAVDQNGNSYVTGMWQWTVDWDPGPDTVQFTSDAWPDGFVVSFDPNGNFRWVNLYSSPGIELPKGLSFSHDNKLLVHGRFSDSLDFDPDTTQMIMTSAGSTDLFIAQYKMDGTFTGVRTFGGTGTDAAEEIDVDDQGNIFITGSYGGILPFDSNISINALQSRDIYLAKLDSTGQPQWAISVQGNNHFEGAGGMDVSPSGEVFLTGCFYDTIDADPDTSEWILSPIVPNDLYILSYSDQGVLTWAESFHTGGVFDLASGVAWSPNGQLAITGTFTDTLFMDGPNGDTLRQTNTYSAFVAYLDLGCGWITTSDSILICSGDSALIHGQWFDQEGWYTDTSITALGCDSVHHTWLGQYMHHESMFNDFLCPGDTLEWQGMKLYEEGFYQVSYPDQNACDSILRISLDLQPIVDSVDIDLLLSQGILFVNDHYGDILGWYECLSDSIIQWGPYNTLILDSNLLALGQLQCGLILLQGDCEVYSECVHLNWQSIHEFGGVDLMVFPNPSDQSVVVRIEGTELREIWLHSLWGELLFYQQVSSSEESLDLRGLAPATYLLRIRDAQGDLCERRLIKSP